MRGDEATESISHALDGAVETVAGDPLSDLAVLRHPAMVVLGGRIVARNEGGRMSKEPAP